MMDNGMSISDIAAVSNGGGFGGNAWVLILLFALIFGWNGNGFGRGNGDYGQYATAASQQEILFGQRFQDIDNKIDRLGNGIADSTYALNNAIAGEGRATQAQLASGFCDIKTAVHAEGEATRAMLQQNKIESLQAKVNELSIAQQLCNVVRYPTASTYNAGANPFCNCGCSC